MTGHPDLFAVLHHKEGGTVTFGDNNKGLIIGIGNIGNIDKPLIKDVLLVKGLKHNLLSISQMCDTGYNVSFNHDACLIADTNENIISKRYKKEIIYMNYT